MSVRPHHDHIGTAVPSHGNNLVRRLANAMVFGHCAVICLKQRQYRRKGILSCCACPLFHLFPCKVGPWSSCDLRKHVHQVHIQRPLEKS